MGIGKHKGGKTILSIMEYYFLATNGFIPEHVIETLYSHLHLTAKRVREDIQYDTKLIM